MLNDEDALRAIRAASTALQEWTHHSSRHGGGEKMWPEGKSTRKWRGVEWSGDRVQQLDLGHSRLEELLPLIGQLKALTKLNLYGCPLNELPPQIGQLTALTNLILTRCHLKKLPPQIGQLTGLTDLDLGESALEELPPQAGQLKALTDLDLRGCKQLKELPPQIGQLTALTKLQVSGCPLKELPPQIGQLTALTRLDIAGCLLKELPPQVGQLMALTDLDLRDSKHQLTLASGAKVGQPASTIVAAYAPLLIVEPRKDSPDELHAFLLDNPLAVAPFFKSILTNAAHADWLGEAVKAAPSLAKLTDADGRLAIDVAHLACRQAMRAAIFLLGRYEVDVGPLLHRSATAAVAAAADHGQPEAKPVPRVALKAMRGVEQVRAELQGRVGLDSKYVVAVKAVYADEEALAGDSGAHAWQQVKDAAAELKIEIEPEVHPDLSDSIQTHFFNQEEVDGTSEKTSPPATVTHQPTQGPLDACNKYTFLLVLELADRSLANALMHDRIAANEWPLVRKMGIDLARGLNSLHANERIHADFKPLNICRVPAIDDNFTTFFAWELIDFDVSCRFGDGFGSKLPSSGYCPPEMAKVLLKAINPSTGVLVNEEELSQYEADVAYDLWSFGVVLFHLGTGKSLWHTNQDDSISQADLRKLANWDERTRKTVLGRFSQGDDKTKDEAALQNLVFKLLEPDRKQRLKHFESKDGESEMQMVLKHPFLAAKSLDDATLQDLSDKLDVVIEMGIEHRIELQHACQVLLRGIFEATEVKTPTTFIILDEVLPPELSVEEQDQLLTLKDDGSGIELTGDAKAAKDRFEKGMTWLKRLQTFGEGIAENNPNKVFGKIKEAFRELVTKETVYFYLVDELTGLPVRGDGYPIPITTPAEIVPKLLMVMQVGMRAMSLYNGVAGVAQMVGYPVPKVPEAWRKGAQSSVEMLKLESSVEAFGAVHAKVQEGDSKQETTRGASLRELQRFFKEHDKDEGYAGLHRIADEDGTAVWTILKETEVAAQLEERTKERRAEERRHEKIFSDQARTATLKLSSQPETEVAAQLEERTKERKQEERRHDDLYGAQLNATSMKPPDATPEAYMPGPMPADASSEVEALRAKLKAAESKLKAAGIMLNDGSGGGASDGKGSKSNNSTSRPALNMTVGGVGDNNHGCVLCSLQ